MLEVRPLKRIFGAAANGAHIGMNSKAAWSFPFLSFPFWPALSFRAVGVCSHAHDRTTFQLQFAINERVPHQPQRHPIHS